MIHPDTELRFISDEIGHGVVATRLIPRGTITWVRDDFDQTFSPADARRLTPVYRQILDKYSFADAAGDLVLCWDLARYVNHSCRPNCLSAGYDFELAVRDILPGEELTDDYGTLNLDADFDCRCGWAGCRRVIRPDNMLRHAEEWDAVVAGAFPMIGAVAQPLWPLLKEAPEVRLALSGLAAIASCRLNYCRAELAAV